MSISALGSSTVSSLFSNQQSQMKRPEDFDSSEDFVSSIISDNDSDGDGGLSVDEAGFLEDRFSEIDTDGDGVLSQEEMVADLEMMQQQKAAMGQLSMAMQGGLDSMISSLFSELDTDGDSLISQEESGLDDELFSAMDTDGDGSISSEEIEAAMQPPEGAMPPPEAMANDAVASSGSSSSSSSEDSEEEYDEYDYNQDGVVTFDELQKAFANGDGSLESIVGQSSSSGEEDEGSGQSILQRMAMRAYEQQNSSLYTGESLGALA